MSDDERAPAPGADDERRARLARLNAAFCDFIPHNQALGMAFVDHGEGEATLRLPYRPALVGNPETGVLHGGALTALLDAASGASVFLALPGPVTIATLDLRIDYLRPATPARDVLARATCFKLTRHIAFVRAVAYHDDPDDPIAASSASFMLSTRGEPTIRVQGGS